MSMTDPIADMLTRIRNGQKAPQSERVDAGFKGERGCCKSVAGRRLHLRFCDRRRRCYEAAHVELKYFEGVPVIETIQRTSKPGLRIYRGKEESAESSGWSGCCDRLDVGWRNE